MDELDEVDELAFRRRMMIDPDSIKQQQCQEKVYSTKQTGELHECGQKNSQQPFIQEQLAFEQKLKQTLEVPVPENIADKVILKQLQTDAASTRRMSHKWFYISLSVLLFVGSVSYFLYGTDAVNRTLYPTIAIPEVRNSEIALKTVAGDTQKNIMPGLKSTLSIPSHLTPDLTQAVIQHLYEDSHALDTFRAYSKVEINTVLASMGGKFSDPIGNVSYLSRCIVGKNIALHLVVKQQNRLITVLLMPSEFVAKPVNFSDPHFAGIIIPSKKGVIAIISENAQSAHAIHDDSGSKQAKTDQPLRSKPDGQRQREIIRERVEKNLRWII